MRTLVNLLLGIALALTVASAARAGEPLSGRTVDYHWDGRDRGHPERAWYGRAYVPRAVKPDKPVALVIFLHGLNAALIKHRWMGGGSEGDVRAIVGKLVDEGAIEPVVVAGPSSVVASQVSRGASWNHFDLDHFIDRTVEALASSARIDESRIVVVGHSGAGCSLAGGLATAGSSRRTLLGLVSIDTCMMPALAKRLARAPARTHVVVSYQKLTWTSRPFAAFRTAFEREVEQHPAEGGVLRELDEQSPKKAPHDATVALTLERWLPKILARR